MGRNGARDFEIFINGSLIKPDMSHLETYPDFYKPMETFVPTRWDFEDLEDKILDLINDKKKRRDFVKWASKLRDIISRDEWKKIL